jgi:uncharacterized protein YxjI
LTPFQVKSELGAGRDFAVHDGDDRSLEGSFIEKSYSMESGGLPAARISQKWVTLPDAYALDVADGTDPGLALAVLWTVDRWVKRD